MAKSSNSRLTPVTKLKRIHPLPRRFVRNTQKGMTKSDWRLFDETLRDLRVYQRQHPNCVEGWLVLGDFTWFKDKEKALECYLNALLWDPVNPEAHMEVAQWLEDNVNSKPLLRFHAETALRNCRYTSDDWMWLGAIIDLADDNKGIDDLARRARRLLRIGFPDDYHLDMTSQRKRKTTAASKKRRRKLAN